MNLPLKTDHAERHASVTIEAMRVSDAEATGALFREVVEALPYYNRRAKTSEIAKHTADELRNAVAVEAASVLVAKTDRELAGFCVSRDDDGTTWLDWFGVRAGYRDMGIGGRMLDALEQRALKRGSHKIWCDSRTTNTASAGILWRHGYSRICTIADHWYRQDFTLWEKFVG